MFCGRCGTKIDIGMNNCPNCGKSVKEEIPVQKEPNKKVIVFGIIGVIVLIIVIILGFKLFSKNERSETLTNLDKNNYLKFNLGGNDFYLGDAVSTYQAKKYSYDESLLDDSDYVLNDSIASQTFYNDKDEAQFLGALYCSEGSNCKYDETVLIKINFYEDSEVIVNDYIKFGMDYDDIVEKYGKEDGNFYQDEELLVWTFGEKGKIGEPYYILRFDNGGLFSTGDLIEIRIGVWWYDGEYEHTVIKGSSEVKS